jgi:hypothetical protein
MREYNPTYLTFYCILERQFLNTIASTSYYHKIVRKTNPLIYSITPSNST